MITLTRNVAVLLTGVSSAAAGST